jgi:hypothetical protein
MDNQQDEDRIVAGMMKRAREMTGDETAAQLLVIQWLESWQKYGEDVQLTPEQVADLRNDLMEEYRV